MKISSLTKRIRPLFILNRPFTFTGEVIQTVDGKKVTGKKVTEIKSRKKVTGKKVARKKVTKINTKRKYIKSVHRGV